MGVVAVIGEHGEPIAEGGGGNEQVNRMNPSCLAAVNQVRLDIPNRQGQDRDHQGGR